MAVRHLNKQAGFLLIEVLAVVALLGVLAGVLLPQSVAYSKQYARWQVQAAANLLAADMRKLQQQALFGDGEQRYLRSLSSGYDYYLKGKKVKQVRFADYGWNVELTWTKRFNVQFGVNGGPTYSGTWVVQHSEFAGVSCTVAVQPVTGRIVVSESE
ncbi:MAG: prepilin-type N-terminal cleavage/methylation domain-containing protein [Phascolarctobacterium sp.]|nr:prepilin-type N-terminal cleavage/methylation domain-containing protein [Phascolarctobacterium sp.]